MKQFLQLASFLYVAFALIIATSSLATLETPAARDVAQRSVVVTTGPTLFDHQRLDNSGEKAESDRDSYTIEVWTASWCGPCKRYKAKEVPALLKSGFKVEVLDYDTDNPPKDIKKVPTVRVYYKGTFLKQQTYWRAKDVAEYVDNHLSLKG